MILDLWNRLDPAPQFIHPHDARGAEDLPESIDAAVKESERVRRGVHPLAEEFRDPAEIMVGTLRVLTRLRSAHFAASLGQRRKTIP